MNQRLHVFGVLRDSDSQRPHFKNARVRAVQTPMEIVKEQLSFNDSTQILEMILALLFVHRFPTTYLVASRKCSKFYFLLNPNRRKQRKQSGLAFSVFSVSSCLIQIASLRFYLPDL